MLGGYLLEEEMEVFKQSFIRLISFEACGNFCLKCRIGLLLLRLFQCVYQLLIVPPHIPPQDNCIDENNHKHQDTSPESEKENSREPDVPFEQVLVLEVEGELWQVHVQEFLTTDKHR